MATVTGTDANNRLTGTNDADELNGLAGDDLLDARGRPTLPGAGIDVVDGGAGFDTLLVDASGESQSVQLSTGGSPSYAVRSDSGNFHVDAYNVERVRFTGGSGNDVINTGERGGSVNGGGGTDLWIADLSGLFVNVVFTLGVSNGVAAAGVIGLVSVERVFLSTGAGADTLTGGAEGDALNGGEGDDVLNGGTRPTSGAIDQLDGGDGTDTLVVDASAETQGVQLGVGAAPTFGVRSDSGNLYVDAYNMERVRFTGGSGHDVINSGDRGVLVQGGAGIDHWVADLSGISAAIAFRLGVTSAILPAGLASIGGIERISLTTGGGADSIIGGAQADAIVTGAGDDTIDARSRPSGGGATDHVDGGAGTDRLVVNAAAETQAVQLGVAGAPRFLVRSDSGNFYVDAYNVEEIAFTGGAGNDVINTGDAAGAVNGGGGIDHWLADLSAQATRIVFALGVTNRILSAELTSILGIERITLATGAGADSIVGGGQADTILTGSGADTIDARHRPVDGGTDQVDGGSGIDTLVVNAAAETQAVQLGVAGAPRFHVRSDSGNFYVDAYNVERVRFTGGAGNDVINTGDGGVAVDGGGGIDHWLADLSAVGANLVFNLGATTAIAAAGLVSLQGIERITLTTGGGADSIVGGAQADAIATGAGNDTLDGRTRQPGGGIDQLDGGLGIDLLVVDAAGETQAVQLLAAGSPSYAARSDSGNVHVDAFNVERAAFTGGAGHDSASGHGFADTFAGGDGADTLDGGGGNDLLAGGAGHDVIRGGRGADQLSGGAGNDRFLYDRPTDSNAVIGLVDSIADFTPGEDVLDLSAVDADGFGFNGNQAFVLVGGFTEVRGELRIVGGAVEGDVNGDGVADFVIGFGGGAPTAADIIL